MIKTIRYLNIKYFKLMINLSMYINFDIVTLLKDFYVEHHLIVKHDFN